MTVRVARGRFSAGRRIIASLAELPALPAPRPVLFRAGPREIQTAVLFPSWHQPGQRAGCRCWSTRTADRTRSG